MSLLIFYFFKVNAQKENCSLADKVHQLNSDSSLQHSNDCKENNDTQFGETARYMLTLVTKNLMLAFALSVEIHTY